MKGALLKEFYVWRKTGLAYVASYIVVGIAFCIAGGVSGVLMGLMLGGVNRVFLEDEKNNWNDYSRALPYTAVQRVSARYIIILCEMSVALIMVILTDIFSFLKVKELILLREQFNYLGTDNLSVSVIVMTLAIALAGLAFAIPVNYTFKGSKRTVIGMIPMIIATIAIVFLPFTAKYYLSMSDTFLATFLKIFFYEKWVTPVFLAISVTMLAVSWIVSIIINTNSGRDKLKKLKITAIILAAVIVAASAVSTGILYKNGRFERDKTDYYEHYYSNLINGNSSLNQEETKPYEPTKDELKCRKETEKLMDNFFSKTHVGGTLEDCRALIEKMGYTETGYTADEYCKGINSKVTIRVYTEPDSDIVSIVNVSTGIGDSNLFKTATTEDMNKIGSRFYEGMSEQEALSILKELELCCNGIREYADPDYGTVKYYMIKCHISEYNGGESANYAINIEAADGKVFDVRIYDNV